MLRYNAEVFTNLCLKKHEFLQYDQLTLVCAIIMASRKVAYLQELWPEELTALTGNRLRFPQIKPCMRHILSFYNDVGCSASNTQPSSPEQPQTVQKTVKRAQITSVSTKKKNRGGEKSQEQTTSKKHHTGVSVVNIGKEAVVTPNKSSLPRNKLSSIAKPSNEKQKVLVSSGQQIALKRASTQSHQISNMKDLSSNKKENTSFMKSTESRADSQPANKKTHVLHK